MKTSQLNAISRNYTAISQRKSLEEITRRGLLAEFNASKYKNPTLFLRYYKTAEERELSNEAKAKATAAAKQAKSQKMTALKIKYNATSIKKALELQELELQEAQKIHLENCKIKALEIIELIKVGTFRISKNLNIINVANNKKLDFGFTILSLVREQLIDLKATQNPLIKL